MTAAMSPPDATIDPLSASHCTATAWGSAVLIFTGTSMPAESGAFIRTLGNT